MRATMKRAQAIFATCACILAMALLVPAAADAQVNVLHVRVTIKPAAGAAGSASTQTGLYCDTGLSTAAGQPCDSGIQVWNLVGGITLNGGQTLALGQTALVTNGANSGSNFDTSDRVRATGTFTDDCISAIGRGCGVKIDLDTGSGLTTVYNSDADNALTKFNTDSQP